MILIPDTPWQAQKMLLDLAEKHDPKSPRKKLRVSLEIQVPSTMSDEDVAQMFACLFRLNVDGPGTLWTGISSEEIK